MEEIDDGGLQALNCDVQPSTVPAQAGAVPPSDAFLRGDAQLVERLRRNNFAGREYDAFAGYLVKIGWSTCRKWLGNGQMQRYTKKRGRPVGDLPQGIQRQDMEDLATDTAVEGVILFRKIALVGGRWAPAGGASLVTYYVGACIHVFPNVYRKWVRGHLNRLSIGPMEWLPEEPGGDGPENAVATRLMLDQLRHLIDERTWTALRMKADNHSYAEIAEVLQVSEKAVEGILRRGKAKATEIVKELGGHRD